MIQNRRSKKTPTLNVELPEVLEAEHEVKGKLSWKMPITYGLATLLALFFATTATGDARLRLKDRSSSIDIPDITIPAVATLWVFFALILIATIWSIVSTLSRGSYGKMGRVLDFVATIVVAVLTIFGFLLLAGGGSAGAITLTSTLGITVAISTPLIFGALSGVVCEHVGVVNIAIEGQLLVGAFVGVMAASFFKTPYVGLLAAPLAGAFVGSLLALFSVKYGVDQIIVGVVLNVLCPVLQRSSTERSCPKTRHRSTPTSTRCQSCVSHSWRISQLLAQCCSTRPSWSTSCTLQSRCSPSSSTVPVGACACAHVANTHVRQTPWGST